MIKVGDPQFLYMTEQEKLFKEKLAKNARDRAINRVVEEIKDKYAGTAITEDELGIALDKYNLNELSQQEWTYLLREIAR